MPANHCVPHTAEAKAKISLAKRGHPLLDKRVKVKIINGITHYRCGSCRSYLPENGFNKDLRRWSGLKSQCKKCHSRSSLKSRDIDNARRLKRESEGRRRARKAGVVSSISSSEMAVLYSLWGSHCVSCGATTDLNWDHIVPLAKGGEHSISNLQRLCRRKTR